MTDRPGTSIERAAADGPDAARLRSLLDAHLAELTRHREVAAGPGDAAGYPYLQAYGSEPGRHAFWIRSGGRTVGFALVRDPRSTGSSRHELAELYVEPGSRRRGVGREAVRALWERLPGAWELQVHARNAAAIHFWSACIAAETGEAPEAEPLEARDGRRLRMRLRTGRRAAAEPPPAEAGTPLRAGRVTQGVVRVGDTVRRPVGPHSRFVHALLRHLEAVGFPHAPRLLGVDARGREILGFIPGRVPGDLADFPLEAIREAARLLAAFHDATAGTALAGGEEVVCHGDPTPCNFVFRAGLPVALLDFDAALPGPRRLDVGYAAWMWLDLGSPESDAREVGRRLAAFLEAYGERAPDDATGAILGAQRWLAQRAERHAPASAFSRDVRDWAEGCRAWVSQHRAALEAGRRGGAG